LDLSVAVPGPDLVDGNLVGIEGHQVGILTTYLPTSIVGVDRWGVSYRMPQILVGGTHGTLGPAQSVLGDGSLG
jgi:hypothetical protein